MTAIRFVHVLGASLWVGGQLLLTLVVLPLARRLLPAESRAVTLAAVGRRFARIAVWLLPVQTVTGAVLAADRGVTLATLPEPGYPRTLMMKLLLLVAAMAAAAVHGIAIARGRPAVARAAVVTSLTCTVGVLFLATALAS
jgi:uncharacterized membrane protein